MSSRTMATVLIILGVVILAPALTANALGIGNVNTFGWKQILGTVAGIVLIAAGLWMSRRKAA